MLSKALLGAGKAASPVYVEDVFSTWLYTGNGSTQTITNGIDLAGKGGLVWFKRRATADNHWLIDTTRGGTKFLISNLTNAEAGNQNYISSFNANGFTIGTGDGEINSSLSGNTYVSWTFREQDRFFDIRTVSHTNGTADTLDFSNLGTLGMVIVKITNTTGNWIVWHRSLTGTNRLFLNLTDAQTVNTVFTVSGTTVTITSAAVTGSYVVYAFAHDAGGFGAAGTDNVISCGSYTGTGASGNTITLGYEPQWVLIKRATGGTGSWIMLDSMRGITMSTDNVVSAEATSAEFTGDYIDLTPTGFIVKATTGVVNTSGSTYIYIAIRRGPMKTPLTSTSVFTPIKTGSGSTLSDSYASIGFPIDMTLRYQTGTNTGATYKNVVFTRLLGINSGASDIPTSTNAPKLLTPATDAASTAGIYYSQTGSMGLNYGGSWNAPDYVLTHLHFRRAPGFFDIVCDTGTGVAKTVTHGLTVVPELMIRKKRNSASNSNWVVWHTLFSGTSKYLYLNTTDAEATNSALWTTTPPTSTVFSVGTGSNTNNTNDTYVTYLFASVNGVSKVGSYTGNGSSQTINCGFAAGARFILIKRTSSTGNWVTFDTARGIVSGNDPALYLNSTAAEVTGVDAIDPDNSGFIVNQETTFNLNVNAATYIYLAIA